MTDKVKEIHVLGLSGGKDSAALAYHLWKKMPDIDFQYFFTDTGEELPEAYDFINKLESVICKPGNKIHRLNNEKSFKWWLKQNSYFLPSHQARWCTLNMKLFPFKRWIKKFLDEGYQVYSYVAIRADEEYRQGYVSDHKNLHVKLPFRDEGIDKAGVLEILESSGLGLPKYYEWRSRSGCTFCFFQQKIEWVRLKERHPDAFEYAKSLEKTAVDHGSPFTWSHGESLEELEKPKRVIQIKEDFEKRVEREKNRPDKYVNPLRADVVDIDDLYGVDEGNGSCNICHK